MCGHHCFCLPINAWFVKQSLERRDILESRPCEAKPWKVVAAGGGGAGRTFPSEESPSRRFSSSKAFGFPSRLLDTGAEFRFFTPLTLMT